MRADAVVGRLAAQARAGDPTALEPLVRATYDDAFGLALRLVGDEHDARDTVQEAYVRVLRGIRRFRGEAAFTTWLHRIIANCAADLMARRSKTAHRSIDALDGAERRALVDVRLDHDPVVRSERGAEQAALVAALTALPDRLRVVVVLHDVHDLSHDAIAAELGITVAASKVRLHRARRRLREELFDAPGLRHRPIRGDDGVGDDRVGDDRVGDDRVGDDRVGESGAGGPGAERGRVGDDGARGGGADRWAGGPRVVRAPVEPVQATGGGGTEHDEVARAG